MALNLTNLDEKTRKHMLKEFEQDVAQGKLYLSHRFNAIGRVNYEKRMREAILNGDDMSLSDSLRGFFNEFEQKSKPNGGYTNAKVPINAGETFAEGEFNRFYCRGICCRAIEDGISEVQVYRAKEVANPRPQSQMLLGKRFQAVLLLDDLRNNIGVDTALGIPAGPNSGLSIFLVE